MLKIPAVLTITGLAMLTACNPMASLHPLATDENSAAVDSAYIGVWKGCHDKDIWKIEAFGDQAYAYRQLDEADSKGRFRLVDLDGEWFADIEPEGGIIPGHLLAKVRLDGDTIHMAFLREEVAAKALPHETVGSGDARQVVITAPTTRLRNFLIAARRQLDAFEKEDTLCRVK